MIEREVANLVREAIAESGLEVEGEPVFEVERPERREHGDWSTNAALRLAKAAGRPPREVAEVLVRHMPRPEWVLSVDVAGPGFINFTLSAAWLHRAAGRVLELGPRFGRSDEGRGEPVNVEFVSLNPTGPLHVGTARNAALGDAIARLLELRGYRVTREYYYNDAGRQMELFGISVAVRYLELLGHGVHMPEDAYHGDYVYDLARHILAEDGDRHADVPLAELGPRMRERAYPIVIGWIEDTLARFGVRFDVWFSERDLYESGRAKAVIVRLEDAGHVYHKDGATWLASEALGDARDRVLVKANGELTYLAGDLAYHLDKAERGFTRIIDVWGADHHGQVPSLLAGMRALGVPAERVEVVVYQFVHMLRGGTPVPMSKRTGSLLSLDEVLDEVGVDAARYTLLETSINQDITFDLEEVTKRSLENPVFYVQYGHARIASILRKGEADGVEQTSAVDWSLLSHSREDELMRHIAEFEETVDAAARQRAPHRVCRYAEELAKAFHRFYTDCRVIGEDAALTGARLALCRATKQVLANALGLLGVSAPERMEWEGES